MPCFLHSPAAIWMSPMNGLDSWIPQNSPANSWRLHSESSARKKSAARVVDRRSRAGARRRERFGHAVGPASFIRPFSRNCGLRSYQDSARLPPQGIHFSSLAHYSAHTVGKTAGSLKSGSPLGSLRHSFSSNISTLRPCGSSIGR